MSIRLVSLGYERRTIQELIDVLIEFKVTKLIDVRERAISRRKDFNKNKLSSTLELAGIKYIHLKIAGNPDYALSKLNIDECFLRYTDYLQNNPIVINIFKEELSDEPVGILCYERNHNDCHRSILIDKLRQQCRGIEVITVE